MNAFVAPKISGTETAAIPDSQAWAIRHGMKAANVNRSSDVPR
ncbi:MAG: hypothetical protein P8Y11_06720 [Gemmatimonadales bacterium]